jgi:hypothetical protein
MLGALQGPFTAVIQATKMLLPLILSRVHCECENYCTDTFLKVQELLPRLCAGFRVGKAV